MLEELVGGERKAWHCKAGEQLEWKDVPAGWYLINVGPFLYCPWCGVKLPVRKPEE